MKTSGTSSTPPRNRSIFAASLLLAFACNANAKKSLPEKPAATEAKMTTPATFFDRIASVAAARPFQPAAVEKLVDLPIDKVGSESNEYYMVYHSTQAKPGSPFAKVEVRSPRQTISGKGGMVIADLTDAAPCIKRDDVGDRFGKAEPTSPAPPRPNAPPDAPQYESYKQPWGIIRLGFSRQTGCLSRVILDAT